MPVTSLMVDIGGICQFQQTVRVTENTVWTLTNTDTSLSHPTCQKQKPSIGIQQMVLLLLRIPRLAVTLALTSKI